MPTPPSPKLNLPNQAGEFWQTPLWQQRIWPGLWVLAYGAAIIALPWYIGWLLYLPISWWIFDELMTLIHQNFGQSQHVSDLIHRDLFEFLAMATASIPFVALGYIQANHGRGLLAYLITLAFVSDTAAFFGGRAIGGPKLLVRVSPGKTWSGALVGVTTAVLVGLFFYGHDWIGIPLGRSILISAGLGAFGICGDLLESYTKRRAGIKDTSARLRGHGGILDRCDALSFIAIGGWILTGLGVLS